MKKLLFLIASSALLIAGCKPATTNTPSGNTTLPVNPKACFSLNKTLLDSGETIITTNCSTNAASYNWDFGLGASSFSSATTPTYTYFNNASPMRGKAYKVVLTAYNKDASKQDDTSAIVTIGYRKIDSIVLVKVPGHTLNDTTIFVRLINGGANPTTTSGQLTPKGLPCTFNMDNIITPKPIIIDHVKSNNDGQWKGQIFANNAPVLSFGLNQASPIYFSRGLDASPIKIKDNGGELDVYYSIVPADK